MIKIKYESPTLGTRQSCRRWTVEPRSWKGMAEEELKFIYIYILAYACMINIFAWSMHVHDHRFAHHTWASLQTRTHAETLVTRTTPSMHEKHFAWFLYMHVWNICMDEPPAFQHSIDRPQRHAQVPANFYASAWLSKQAQSQLVHMHDCDACCWDLLLKIEHITHFFQAACTSSSRNVQISMHCIAA